MNIETAVVSCVSIICFTFLVTEIIRHFSWNKEELISEFRADVRRIPATCRDVLSAVKGKQ